jgi:hypothetical protein
VPGIDINKLMYPLVDILSPPPTQHAVKQFHCISLVCVHFQSYNPYIPFLGKTVLRYRWIAQQVCYAPLKALQFVQLAS